jgi:predicted enzyme related to lactoylglutathione lyase
MKRVFGVKPFGGQNGDSEQFLGAPNRSVRSIFGEPQENAHCPRFVPINLRIMPPNVKSAIPVLPAADVSESLAWWVGVCGFRETFRDATPPSYAGVARGGAELHLAAMDDKQFARQVGDQTMVRIAVEGIKDLYAEYQERGGKVHPNGPLQTKPWGRTEFGAIDPNGVCVTFAE